MAKLLLGAIPLDRALVQLGGNAGSLMIGTYDQMTRPSSSPIFLDAMG